MIAPARIAAYEILSAVSAGNADLPTAIALARASLNDERDRALAAEIAAGVQRRRAALDHLIVESEPVGARVSAYPRFAEDSVLPDPCILRPRNRRSPLMPYGLFSRGRAFSPRLRAERAR